MYRSMSTLVLCALVAVAGCVGLQASDAESSLEGAWGLAEWEVLTPDGRRIPGSAQESFLLFSGSYYSMNWATGKAPSPYYSERFAPTDAEKIDRYSSTLVNAGRFETSDGVLTITPEFALVPEYVGGLGEFDYQIDGDTLDLVWRRIESKDGVPDPNTAIGVKFHYVWVRMPTTEK